MATQHRATMGGLPTIPQTVMALAMPLAMMGKLPPHVQMAALIALTEQVAATAVSMQMVYSPRPVV